MNRLKKLLIVDMNMNHDILPALIITVVVVIIFPYLNETSPVLGLSVWPVHDLEDGNVSEVSCTLLRCPYIRKMFT